MELKRPHRFIIKNRKPPDVVYAALNNPPEIPLNLEMFNSRVRKNLNFIAIPISENFERARLFLKIGAPGPKRSFQTGNVKRPLKVRGSSWKKTRRPEAGFFFRLDFAHKVQGGALRGFFSRKGGGGCLSWATTSWKGTLPCAITGEEAEVGGGRRLAPVGKPFLNTV